MNSPLRRHQLADAALALLGSARFSQALTLAAIGMAFLAFTARSTIGWPGLIGAVCSLVVLAALSLMVKRHELEWRGLLPISLLAFLGWTALSLIWSGYQWVTLGSSAYQLAFAFLGVYIALTRDLIQIVRAFGDVLRLAIVVSLGLEVLSGLLLDTPFHFLDIAGTLDEGGPIQGIAGRRNQLGLIALIALITFFVELKTRSVARPVAITSIAFAGLTALLTRSPVALGTFEVVLVAAGILFGLRRADATARRVWQFVLLAVVVVAAGILFLARTRVIGLLNAGSEFEVRYSLWRDILELIPANTLEGFGWIGLWRRDIPPFIGIDPFPVPHETALNAYLDVWLQLGIVGLCSFIALVGLALVRSWLLASNKRSVAYLWPALMLVALVIVSAAESSALVEFGWLTLVICAVRASHDESWRVRLPPPDPSGAPLRPTV